MVILKLVILNKGTSLTSLTIGSLFSGVGGLEHALLEDPRFELTYVADPDKYCEAVMNYIYRTTPNLGSVTKIKS
jgi:site-specific DNA-cytosine methylase